MTGGVWIETARLILRTVSRDDIDAVALNWKLYEGPISRQEAETKVDWMLANHRQNMPGKLAHLCLAIIDKNTQEWIGWCGLDHLDAKKVNPVLFYLLKTHCWGKGLATEAAEAVLAYAFEKLDLTRIDSACAFENVASRRVMEKIGMKYMGLDEEGGHFFTLKREEYLEFTRSRPQSRNPKPHSSRHSFR